MKIRRDYVTNSSSSSFILSFADEDSIYDTLKEQFPKDIESGWSAGEYGYLSDLLNRISDEKDSRRKISRKLLRTKNDGRFGGS